MRDTTAIVNRVRLLRSGVTLSFDRYPVTVTLGIAVALLVLAWWGMFFGGLIAPYDYRTADYPGYVESLRGARYSVFCLYNPFNDGGVMLPNLIADFDPVEWLPLLGTGIPGYAVPQSLYLAHLVLIPIGLLMVARANGVPRSRWVLIAAIALIAYGCGPYLKYMQQSTAIVAVSCYVFFFGALEAYRRFGGVHYVVLAGVAFAYATAHWVYATIYFPILLAAYVAANPGVFVGTRRRIAEALGAVAVSLAIASPNLLSDVKFDHTIEVARHLEKMLDLIQFSDLPGMLGAPLRALAIMMLPAGMLVLVVAGLANSSRRERWIYGIALTVLVLYSLGDLTPFGPVFRAIYPPAAMVRRPYTVWYVLWPFMLFLSVRGLGGTPARVARIIALASAVATGVGWIAGAPWLAAVVVLATLAGLALRPRPTVVVAAALVQWAAIAWVPFWHSEWRPTAIPASARYLAPYQDVRAYLPFETSDSLKAYRIANVGLPAEFGPSAGAWLMYGSVATYNTSAPHELVSLLGMPDVHATVLPSYLAVHPAQFADANWRRLGIRYYLIGPETLATIPQRAFAKPGLRKLDVPGYWNVIEDGFAAPFVSAQLRNGAVVAVQASMRRDSYDFTVPTGAVLVRFANIFDPWWTLSADPAPPRGAVRDYRGQLVLDARGLEGRRVHLAYWNGALVTAIAVKLAAQAGLAVWLLALVLSAARRRPTSLVAPRARQ